MGGVGGEDEGVEGGLMWVYRGWVGGVGVGGMRAVRSWGIQGKEEAGEIGGFSVGDYTIEGVWV